MDTLFFFSKSAHRMAGRGANESVLVDNYDELNLITDWRKMLSNFYVAKFTYEAKTYHTVEHALQAKKIELIDKDKAFLFCIESGSIIGNTPNGEIARKNRKIVILDTDNLAKWDQMKSGILREILMCKFGQNDFLKETLLKTKNAVLTHGARGIPIMRQIELENVRYILRNNDNM